MPKPKVQKIHEKAEGYDKLSQDAQDIWDEICALGWRVEKQKNGFLAQKMQGEGTAGPCDLLAALLGEVLNAGSSKKGASRASAKPDESDIKTTKLEADSKGNRYLSGQEPIVHKDLGEEILVYRATTMEILELQATQRVQKANMLGLMHKYIDDLETDEAGTRFYTAVDIICELVVNETESLKTRVVE